MRESSKGSRGGAGGCWRRRIALFVAGLLLFSTCSPTLVAQDSLSTDAGEEVILTEDEWAWLEEDVWWELEWQAAEAWAVLFAELSEEPVTEEDGEFLWWLLADPVAAIGELAADDEEVAALAPQLWAESTALSDVILGVRRVTRGTHIIEADAGGRQFRLLNRASGTVEAAGSLRAVCAAAHLNDGEATEVVAQMVMLQGGKLKPILKALKWLWDKLRKWRAKPKAPPTPKPTPKPTSKPTLPPQPKPITPPGKPPVDPTKMKTPDPNKMGHMVDQAKHNWDKVLPRNPGETTADYWKRIVEELRKIQWT